MVPYYRQEEERYHKPSLWSRSVCPSSRFMFHVSGIRSFFLFGVIAKPVSRAHLFAYHSCLATRPTHTKLGFSDILSGTVARCHFLSFDSVIFRCLRSACLEISHDDSIDFHTYGSDHEVNRAVSTGLPVLEDMHRS